MLYKYSMRNFAHPILLPYSIYDKLKKVHIVTNDKLVLNCRELYLLYKHAKKRFISIANNNW